MNKTGESPKINQISAEEIHKVEQSHELLENVQVVEQIIDTKDKELDIFDINNGDKDNIGSSGSDNNIIQNFNSNESEIRKKSEPELEIPIELLNELESIKKSMMHWKKKQTKTKIP